MRKILVVEDNDSIREVLGTFLRRQGYCPFLASTVPSGLLIWRDLQKDIDTVISDYILLDKTANDLLPIVKINKPETRTILISGSAPWTFTEEFMKNVDLFLPKPLDFSKQLLPALSVN